MLVALYRFVKRFLFDPTFAVARGRALIAALAGSGYTWAPDLAEALGDSNKTGWIKLAAGLLGVIAFAMKAGEKNDTPEQLAAKLAAAGYQVTPPATSAAPEAPPAQPPAGS